MSSGDEQDAELNEYSPNGLVAVKVEITEDDDMENSSDAAESIPRKNPVVQESFDGSGPSPGPSTKPRAKVR